MYLGTDFECIQKHYRSLMMVVLMDLVAGMDTFRGYLTASGFQGKESLF